MPELLVATKNAGKVRELEEMLAGLPVRLRSLEDFPNVNEPDETGATFAENAALKARYYAGQIKITALADDSGLAVEALGGAPGIFSARYAGEQASDTQRIKKLLAELSAATDENRRARFVCAAAFADETGKVKFVEEGVCDGKITLAPRGTNGFGYDPVFIPDGFSQTFGELSNEIKRQISHRAQALNKIIQQIRRFYAAFS